MLNFQFTDNNYKAVEKGLVFEITYDKKTYTFIAGYINSEGYHNIKNCKSMGEAIVSCQDFFDRIIIYDREKQVEEPIKRCPFCGEYPLVQNAHEGAHGADDSHGEWEVHCDAGKHMAFTGVFNTREEAINEWNRRAR